MLSSLHHKKLQMQEWYAHWALLISFPSAVESETVVFAHAVMVILFGSYTDLHYSSCRPKGMAPTPQWGLNEIGPLGRNGLSFYNKVEEVSDLEVIDRTRQRLRSNSFVAASTRQRRRCDRLKDGGDIHVNVFKTGSRVRRFFITPMTAADGAHFDITIPLGIGLTYGLEQSRTVHMRLDLSTKNHHTPYAFKSDRNSGVRQLGILLTGSIANGPRKGAKFSHWLQSQRKEGPAQAEKLIKFLESQGGTPSALETTHNQRPNTVLWAKDSFKSSTEPPADYRAAAPRTPTQNPTISQQAIPKISQEFSTIITQGDPSYPSQGA